MRDIESALRTELRDREYSEGYAESFLNSFIATQIKVIREQRKMTQARLGDLIGTTQAGVSRYENVDYSSWNIKSLMKMARAFHLRLRVSFETFGTLPKEAARFNRESLERAPREEDPGLEDRVVASSVSAYQGRGGNVVSIDSVKTISATDKKGVEMVAFSELVGTESNQSSEQEALWK